MNTGRGECCLRAWVWGAGGGGSRPAHCVNPPPPSSFGKPPARGAVGVTGLAISGDLAAGVIAAGKLLTARWASGFAARSSLRSRRPSGPQPQYNILHYSTPPPAPAAACKLHPHNTGFCSLPVSPTSALALFVLLRLVFVALVPLACFSVLRFALFVAVRVHLRVPVRAELPVPALPPWSQSDVRSSWCWSRSRLGAGAGSTTRQPRNIASGQNSTGPVGPAWR
jgi:hypothetical protein